MMCKFTILFRISSKGLLIFYPVTIRLLLLLASKKMLPSCFSGWEQYLQGEITLLQ
jgi:hypothetical protein